MHAQVGSLLQRKQYAQRTPEWYQVRECMLTASDAAAALDIKPFDSYRGSPREELLRKKTDPAAGASFSNRFTEHGNAYEDEARGKYEGAFNEQVLEFGLLVHPAHPWLGASPDGVTTTGKVVEIKCPISREIVPGHVPHHYFPQVQIVMEVCDLDETVFIQYKPSAMTWPRPEEFDVTVVRRDREWFKEKLPLLQSFYDAMVAGKAGGATRAATTPRVKKARAPPARAFTSVFRADLYAADSTLHVDVASLAERSGSPGLGDRAEGDTESSGSGPVAAFAFLDDDA